MRWFWNKQERDALDERILPAGLRASQLAARRVPLVLRLAIVLPPFIATIYFAATFSGPFGYIGRLEARIFEGSYHPQLAFLVTLLVCLVPALIAMSFVKRLYPPTDEELGRPPRATAREKKR